MDALDYVLKPFDESRVVAAFDRARCRITQGRIAHWARKVLASTPERALPTEAEVLETSSPVLKALEKASTSP